MKQIDGNAMIRRVEALYKRDAVDLSYYNIVKEAVQMETAVDAIPVDWLVQQRDMRRAAVAAHPDISEGSMAVLRGINVVLELWEDEKEAR